MAITASAVRAELGQFFQNIRAQITGQTLTGIPLIGTLDATSAADSFAGLASAVDVALAAVSDSPAAIAAALDALDGISAQVSGGNVLITIDAVGAGVALADAAFNAGTTVTGIGLDLDGTFQTQLTPTLRAELLLDGGTGGLSVEGSATDELTIALQSNLSLTDTEGKLGFLDITATDVSGATPEIALDLTIDLPTGAASNLAVPLSATRSGTAGLDLEVTTTAVDLLPSLSTELTVDIAFAAGVAGPPLIAFGDISLDLSSYFGALSKIASELSEILNAAPLGQILDIMTEAIPVIDDLASTFGLTGALDKVGNDDIVSLLDLAALEGDAIKGISPFLDALVVLDTIRDIADAAGLAPISLGSFTLPANPLNAPDTLQGGANPILQLDSAIANGPLSGLSALADKFSAITGIHLSLLENPKDVVKLLLNDVFPAVDLITYDIPAINFSEKFEKFIPILGPIGAVFLETSKALSMSTSATTRKGSRTAVQGTVSF